MNFFKNLFKTQDNSLESKWKKIEDKEIIEEIKTLSDSQPVVIFKHSTRCGISRTVLKRFESEFDFSKITAYYLDLLNFRELSNQIADDFEVIHQSPQILVIKNRKAIYSASHENIDAKTVMKHSEVKE